MGQRPSSRRPDAATIVTNLRPRPSSAGDFTGISSSMFAGAGGAAAVVASGIIAQQAESKNENEVPEELRTPLGTAGCPEHLKNRRGVHRDCERCWASQMEEFLSYSVQMGYIPYLKLGAGGGAFMVGNDPREEQSRVTLCDSRLWVSLMETRVVYPENMSTSSPPKPPKRAPKIQVALHPPRNSTNEAAGKEEDEEEEQEAKSKVLAEEEKKKGDKEVKERDAKNNRSGSAEAAGEKYLPLTCPPRIGTRVIHILEGAATAGPCRYGTVVDRHKDAPHPGDSLMAEYTKAQGVDMVVLPKERKKGDGNKDGGDEKDTATSGSPSLQPPPPRSSRLSAWEALRFAIENNPRALRNTTRKEKKKRKKKKTLPPPDRRCYVIWDGPNKKKYCIDISELALAWRPAARLAEPTDDEISGKGLQPLALATAGKRDGKKIDGIIVHSAPEPEVGGGLGLVTAKWKAGAHFCDWRLSDSRDPKSSVIEVSLTWNRLSPIRGGKGSRSFPYTGRFEVTLDSDLIPANSISDRWYKLQHTPTDHADDDNNDDVQGEGKTTKKGRGNKKKNKKGHGVVEYPDVWIRARVAYSALPPLRTCCVCYDDFRTDSPGYVCPADPEHTQCQSCFRNFIRVSCEQYMLGKLPVKCPMCKTLVAEQRIHELLPPKQWERYVLTSISAGLNDRAYPDSVPVTCQKCNTYHEFFPPDFQATAKVLFKALVHERAEEMMYLLNEKKRRFWAAYAREQRRQTAEREAQNAAIERQKRHESAHSALEPIMSKIKQLLQGDGEDNKSLLTFKNPLPDLCVCFTCGKYGKKMFMRRELCHTGHLSDSTKCKLCGTSPAFTCCQGCTYHSDAKSCLRRHHLCKKKRREILDVITFRRLDGTNVNERAIETPVLRFKKGLFLKKAVNFEYLVLKVSKDDEKKMSERSVGSGVGARKKGVEAVALSHIGVFQDKNSLVRGGAASVFVFKAADVKGGRGQIISRVDRLRTLSLPTPSPPSLLTPTAGLTVAYGCKDRVHDLLGNAVPRSLSSYHNTCQEEYGQLPQLGFSLLGKEVADEAAEAKWNRGGGDGKEAKWEEKEEKENKTEQQEKRHQDEEDDDDGEEEEEEKVKAEVSNYVVCIEEQQGNSAMGLIHCGQGDILEVHGAQPFYHEEEGEKAQMLSVRLVEACSKDQLEFAGILNQRFLTPIRGKAGDTGWILSKDVLPVPMKAAKKLLNELKKRKKNKQKGLRVNARGRNVVPPPPLPLFYPLEVVPPLPPLPLFYPLALPSPLRRRQFLPPPPASFHPPPLLPR